MVEFCCASIAHIWSSMRTIFLPALAHASQIYMTDMYVLLSQTIYIRQYAFMLCALHMHLVIAVAFLITIC